MQPYGIISDTHNHNWSAFATVNENGINSRLQFTLDETAAAAQRVLHAGGKYLYHGGDLFHVRGSIAPSVLNPTLDTYREIISWGIIPVINAGNHDLEGKEADRVSSAITAMEQLGCIVINKPTIHENMYIVPWIQNTADLKAQLEEAVKNIGSVADMDLLIHAPIDGVISGLPDHGLTANYLTTLGFGRVFAGHYHHHAQMHPGVAVPDAADKTKFTCYGEVYSIGAAAHQTWGDVGSKAGHLIVDADVRWHESAAPKFVEVDGTESQDDLAAKAANNYVKARVGNLKQADVENMRAFLTSMGAAGVVIQVEKAATTPSRTGSTYKSGTTMEASIKSFITSQTEMFKRPNDLAIRCNEILARVRAA